MHKTRSQRQRVCRRRRCAMSCHRPTLSCPILASRRLVSRRQVFEAFQCPILARRLSVLASQHEAAACPSRHVAPTRSALRRRRHHPSASVVRRLSRAAFGHRDRAITATRADSSMLTLLRLASRHRHFHRHPPTPPTTTPSRLSIRPVARHFEAAAASASVAAAYEVVVAVQMIGE